MAHILDSNMLLRWANKGDPERPIALAAMRKLARPLAANGLGLTPAHTERLVHHLRTIFPLLPDTEAVFKEWLRLVVAAAVSGRQVHDTRLVAVMLAHSITHILTFNVSDFRRYEPFGITVVHPADV